MTCAILFLRAAPADKTTYEVSTFEPEGKNGVWVKKQTVTVEGAVEWKVGDVTRQAWVAAVNDGERTIRMAFDPVTREFLGAQGVEIPIGMVPKSAVAAPKVDLSKPAPDARTAAVKVGLAFAVGDKAMAESTIHWPSAYAAAMEDAGEAVDPAGLDAFKQAVLANVTEKAPRAMVEPALLGSLDQFKTETLEGGNVRVTFPAMFQGMVFEAREFDGQWLVVRLPRGG
jgi:hypothetical protein